MTKRVGVIVLGDIGRSPRMQYHAQSISTSGIDVEFVGYKGSPPLETLANADNVNFHYVQPASSLPPDLPKILYLIYAPFKAIWLALNLFFILLTLPQCDYFLLQNPPAIPTLLITKLVSYFKGVKLIIDWHNLGYSIMSINFGENNKLVKLAKWYEFKFGKVANYHLCVSEEMKKFLIEEIKVEGEIIVLYDQPPKYFRRLSLDEIHSFWLELENEYHNIKQISSKIGLATNGNQTLITQQNSDKNVEYRQNRPKVLISSTSWTIDEDFSILLDALKQYDDIQSSKSNPQHLVVIITGKGPLKEHYEELFESAGYQHSTVVTAWLSYDHYSKLLGSVDYGLSFHTSSSGLDLPMKVVDMLACSLPVLALNFNCLDELVTPDSQANYKFNNSEELFNHLKNILSYDNQIEPENIKPKHFTDWTLNWNTLVKPIFTRSN